MRFPKSNKNLYTQDEKKVIFKELLPMQLKNRVSGKGERANNVACLQEMFLAFSCLKQHEFNQASCSKEINTFQQCAAKFRADKIQRKKDEKAGVLTPGATKMSFSQVNILLKKFKQ